MAALALGTGSASAFAPTPSTPSWGGIPGALPPGFHYVYDSAYRGWPVRPLHSQHPVRGSFLDPRGQDDTGLSGYHFGIDVSIDDRRPDPGAPPGLSHRIYAVESGTATVGNKPGTKCLSRRVEVGHFAYWHVSATVAEGAHVRAGQQIGWSCLHAWHVHVSEWQVYRGVLVWVNPLHKGGRLAPYTDTAPPVIGAMTFVTPPARPWNPTVNLASPDTSRPLRPGDLHGLVELRANIGDPQSYLGFLADNPAWPTVFTPYRVAVRVQAGNGRTVLDRVSFQADQLPQTPYIVHYAPGTVEDENMLECLGPPQHKACAGTYRFRPFSTFRLAYWNTALDRNGRYTVDLTAWDIAGNHTSRTVTTTVSNPGR
jgi:hypothetical protein